MDNRDNPQDPEWLEEFQLLANDQLGHGSACQQVHPIVERWLDDLLEGDPPDSRPSVWQAMACLTTEIIFDDRVTPQEMMDSLLEQFSEDDVAYWLETVVLVGRAFQMALEKGDLDDL
ncbi:MAG: hypothetical protein JW910_07220 [Anaerolineae bacterium]|nr:hypothetical protein [Anaerolineae bacterium]